MRIERLILLNCLALIWFTAANEPRGDRVSGFRWKYVLCCFVKVDEMMFKTFIEQDVCEQ